MIKEVILRFEIDKNSFKDGNLLLYNKDEQYFYAISPEQFLTKQNQEIKNLKKICDDRMAKAEKRVEELEKKYNEFLSNYKESNAKLLSMVENFIKVYENGGNK